MTSRGTVGCMMPISLNRLLNARGCPQIQWLDCFDSSIELIGKDCTRDPNGWVGLRYAELHQGYVQIGRVPGAAGDSVPDVGVRRLGTICAMEMKYGIKIYIACLVKDRKGLYCHLLNMSGTVNHRSRAYIIGAGGHLLSLLHFGPVRDDSVTIRVLPWLGNRPSDLPRPYDYCP